VHQKRLQEKNFDTITIPVVTFTYNIREINYKDTLKYITV